MYRDDQNAILQAAGSSSSAFENALNRYIDWTPQVAADLEDSIRSGPLSPRCQSNQEVSFPLSPVTI